LRRNKIFVGNAVAAVESGMPRREATPVTLTAGQKGRIENLWFVFGNRGPKTTPGNHYFIQSIYEHGIDIRPLITKRSRKSEIPTKECEEAVDRILREGDDAVTARPGARALRLLPSPARPRPPLQLDAEVKEMLDEMKRRHASGAAPTNLDNTPDVA
jgi:hypothetical protein